MSCNCPWVIYPWFVWCSWSCVMFNNILVSFTPSRACIGLAYDIALASTHNDGVEIPIRHNDHSILKANKKRILIVNNQTAWQNINIYNNNKRRSCTDNISHSSNQGGKKNWYEWSSWRIGGTHMISLLIFISCLFPLFIVFTLRKTTIANNRTFTFVMACFSVVFTPFLFSPLGYLAPTLFFLTYFSSSFLRWPTTNWCFSGRSINRGIWWFRPFIWTVQWLQWKIICL